MKQTAVQSLYSTLVVTLVLVSIGVMFVVPQKAEALIPYGGRIIAVTPCPCSGSVMLQIGPPKPGFYFVTPGTLLYAFHSVSPPAWHVGQASSPYTCMIPSPTGCTPVGGGLRIDFAGTSVY